jgi:hypothetical protein
MSAKKQRTDDSPLLAWAASRGIKLHGVSVRAHGDDASTGLGIFADEELGPGRTVLFVPDAQICTADMAATSVIGKAVEEAGYVIIRDVAAAKYEWIRRQIDASGSKVQGGSKPQGVQGCERSITSRSVLYALLIYLRSIHKYSDTADCEDVCDKFAPYVRALPENIPSILRWTAGESGLLPSEIVEGIEELRPHVEQQFAAMFPALSQARPDLFPPSIFSLDQWLWADSVFSSRCFPPSLSLDDKGVEEDEDGVLIPLIDFLNHDHLGCHVDIVRSNEAGREGVAAVIRQGPHLSLALALSLPLARSLAVSPTHAHTHAHTKMSQKAPSYRDEWGVDRTLPFVRCACGAKLRAQP